MPKFRVEITRVSYSDVTIEVEADNWYDASSKARERCVGLDYIHYDDEYDVAVKFEIVPDKGIEDAEV